MKNIIIKSSRSDYEVGFKDAFQEMKNDVNNDAIFIIDHLVYKLYIDHLDFLDKNKVCLIHASEKNKTMERAQDIIFSLIEMGAKRSTSLVAIGGGIIQDLTCFVASIMFRGISWKFYPTTLLAQCDSCIGSKSSINVGNFKNQVGTFYPPKQIVIDVNFLKTLEGDQILSGLGEAIKVHYLDVDKRYQQIFDNYVLSLTDDDVMTEVVRNSLLIKRDVIEIDEFDTDYRNIMNYGHTFGHAIETITDYGVPHGIAVTLGMGVANYISMRMGFLDKDNYDMMKSLIDKNTSGFKFNIMGFENQYWSALSKDKKNIDSNLVCILTKGFGQMFKNKIPIDDNLKSLILDYSNS